jgi:hypothetical protein
MELEIYSPSKDGFVKEITWNHEQIKKEVAERIQHYATMIYTEDQVKVAKADRAKLRKFVDALETKRKEIKKQCLAPYEAFEKQMKEIVGLVNEPILLIDRQVKEYEEIQKAEKREAIEAYWISLSEDAKIPEGISFAQIFNEKWLNASVSLKAVCSEIDARLEQIAKDLATLAEMPEFAFEAIETYKHTLDINHAIGEGKRLSEMQKRKAEAERLRAEQEAAVNYESSKAADPVNNVTSGSETSPADSFEEIPKQWVTFTALLSKEDAFALKDFFTARNIEYKATRNN